MAFGFGAKRGGKPGMTKPPAKPFGKGGKMAKGC